MIQVYVVTSENNVRIFEVKAMTFKNAVRIEHLLGHKFKASLGMAQAVSTSKAKAIEERESQAVWIVENATIPRMEVRQGYLIVSQVDHPDSAWYTIKRIADMKDGVFYPNCMLHPSKLKEAIESHLKQYIEQEIGK